MPLLNRVVSKKEVGGILCETFRGKYSLGYADKDAKQPERVWTFKKDVIEKLAKGYELKAREIKAC